MAKRRDKREMLKRAFERVGFTVVKTEPVAFEDTVNVYIQSFLPLSTAMLECIGLHVTGMQSGSGDKYIRVYMTAAFERWYQEEFGTDG